MPRKNIPMYLSSRNTQTTAYHRFHAIRQNPKHENFQMNTGCCGNRNPLIGWRKEGYCCTSDERKAGGAAGWQEVFQNVNGPGCCKPKLRMVQNRGRSSKEQTNANRGRPYNVSGKIDKSYNHNYRQYLKKRCMIASYDRASGRQLSRSTSGDFSTNVFDGACCTTNCAPVVRANVTTYKRNNWNFRKQGAVDNNLYMTRKVQKALNVNELFEELPCHCVCDHNHILHITDAGEIVGGDDTAWEIPVRRRPPPQYVEDNPKNYNHGTHTFANNH